MTLRTILVVGALLMWPQGVLAHEPTPPAPATHAALSVFGQLGGSALFPSLSAVVDYRPISALSLRAGLAALVFCWDACEALPGGWVGASWLLGEGNHKGELGFEYTKFPADDDMEFYGPIVGYRYQPEAGGVLVRPTLQLLIRANDASDMLPIPGLGVGYTW